MTKSKGPKPDATAYMVRDFESVSSSGEVKNRSNWTKIGSVWKHKDGDGFNLRLEAFPVSGSIIIRANKADDKADDNEGETYEA